jgi:DNA gyrase subunit A
LLPDEAVVVCVSKSGQMCRWPAEQGLQPARGRQKDPLVVAAPAHTHDTLYLFTADGRAVIVPMHQMPEGHTPGDGANITEFCSGSVKAVIAGLSLSNAEEPAGYLFLVSRAGRVKRITLADLVSIRGNEAVVMGVEKGDSLLAAFTTEGKGEVMLVNAKGQAIRFSEEEVRPMGLPAAGVWGMKLAKGDELVGAGLVKPRGDLVVITRQGVGKRTALSQYPKQGRYGQGVIAVSLTKAAGPITAAATVNASDRVMMVSQKGNTKTVYAKALPKLNRNQRGKALMAIRGKDKVDQLVVLVQ